MSTTTSPNMNLIIPGVGTEDGPQYAEDVNSSLTIIDQHDHSNGSGVQVTPNGIDINTALTFNGNFATNLAGLTLTAQLSTPANGTIYRSGNDMYYNNGAGLNIQITNSSGIAGSPGSISGLTSPASASYSSGSQTFIWQSNTSIAANMDFGAAVFRNLSPNSTFGVTMSAPAALGSNYSIVLPTLPSSQKIMTLDNSGNLAAPYLIDGSTLTITSNIIMINAGGVGTTQLANSAVTSAKIAAGTIVESNIAAGTITNTSISATAAIAQTKLATPATNTSSAITASTNSLTFTSSGVTLSGTSNARPVMINFTCTTGTVADGYLGAAGAADTSGSFRVVETVSGRIINTGTMRRDGTGGTLIRIPVSTMNCVDIAPGASGTALTYVLQYQAPTGVTTSVVNCKMVVVQL